MSKSYPVHYCGKAHDPKQECPATEWKPGGVVPLSRVRANTKCSCKGLEHEANCERRAAITRLEKGKRGSK